MPRRAKQLPLVDERLKPDLDTLKLIIDSLSNVQAIALDVETETEWPGEGPSEDYGLSYSAEITYLSLAFRVKGEVKGVVVQAPLPGEALAVLRWFFESGRCVIAHNAVFDMRQLSKYYVDHLVPASVWDTMTMQRLLSPMTQEHYDLLTVASALGIQTTQAQKEIKSQRASLSKLEPKQVIEYVLADAIVALMIYEKQKALADAQVLGEEGKTFELVTWECEAIREFCLMSAQGVRIDKDYIEQRQLELDGYQIDIQKRLMADGLLDPGSPPKRVKWIYGNKGIPRPDPATAKPYFFTQKGGLSTSADVVELLAEDYEELGDLAAWMRIDRLQSSLKAMLDHASIDGRVHSLVTVATETGRRSSSHPNVQNIKMVSDPDDLSGNMSGVFIGDEGFTLVEKDYSNAENWMAALVAGDNNLAKACASSDFHSAMAEQYFGALWRESSELERKRLRRMSKTVTFGTAYGMGIDKLSVALDISTEQASKLIWAKNRAFLAVTRAKKIGKQRVAERGYISVWTGRRIPVRLEKSYISWDYVCQGGVAELVKRSIVDISREFREKKLESYVAFDMHDALVIAVRHTEWGQALEIVTRVMETQMPAEYNRRTNPPIQWIAKSDLAENQKKWGKNQWHPEEQEKGNENEQEIGEKTGQIEENILGDVPGDKEKIPVENQTQEEITDQKPIEISVRSVKISFPDLDPEWACTLSPDIPLSSYSDKNLSVIRACLENLLRLLVLAERNEQNLKREEWAAHLLGQLKR